MTQDGAVGGCVPVMAGGEIAQLRRRRMAVVAPAQADAMHVAQFGQCEGRDRVARQPVRQQRHADSGLDQCQQRGIAFGPAHDARPHIQSVEQFFGCRHDLGLRADDERLVLQV